MVEMMVEKSVAKLVVGMVEMMAEKSVLMQAVESVVM
jgi:hypothetical protein